MRGGYLELLRRNQEMRRRLNTVDPRLASLAVELARQLEGIRQPTRWRLYRLALVLLLPLLVALSWAAAVDRGMRGNLIVLLLLLVFVFALHLVTRVGMTLLYRRAVAAERANRHLADEMR